MNTKILRKLGYLSDRDGIMNRFINEQENWKNHLENTKNFILESASNKKNENAVLFGTGWWLDIPTSELCSMFRNVYFFDIIHPAQIIHKSLKFKNLKLIETDITGLCENVYLGLEKGIKNISSIEHKKFDFREVIGTEPDFVASVNILNQLDIILLSYIRDKISISEDENKRIRTEIQKKHIELLPSKKSCLISDCIEINYNEKKEEISRTNLIYTDLPSKKPEKEWIWKFDTNGSYRKACTTHFQVRAFSSF